MSSLKFTVYKITNLVNGKTYIGKHATRDINDGYMGSGKLIKAAIRKHGIENFAKEILRECDSEDEMNRVEAKLVTEDYCLNPNTYNLCSGGNGGFSYINRTRDHALHSATNAANRDYTATNWTPVRDATRAGHKAGKYKYNAPGFTFKGMKHTLATKTKMSLSKKGKTLGDKNSQFGTIWITNGYENRKILENTVVPEGWSKGRFIRPLKLT